MTSISLNFLIISSHHLLIKYYVLLHQYSHRSTSQDYHVCSSAPLIHKGISAKMLSLLLDLMISCTFSTLFSSFCTPDQNTIVQTGTLSHHESQCSPHCLFSNSICRCSSIPSSDTYHQKDKL